MLSVNTRSVSKIKTKWIWINGHYGFLPKDRCKANIFTFVKLLQLHVFVEVKCSVWRPLLAE